MLGDSVVSEENSFNGNDKVQPPGTTPKNHKLLYQDHVAKVADADDDVEPLDLSKHLTHDNGLASIANQALLALNDTVQGTAESLTHLEDVAEGGVVDDDVEPLDLSKHLTNDNGLASTANQALLALSDAVQGYPEDSTLHEDNAPNANQTSLSPYTVTDQKAVNLSTLPSCDSLFSMIDMGTATNNDDNQVHPTTEAAEQSHGQMPVPSTWAEVEKQQQPSQVTHDLQPRQRGSKPDSAHERSTLNSTDMLACRNLFDFNKGNLTSKSRSKKSPLCKTPKKSLSGKTPGNRNRKLVQHNYRDYSHRFPGAGKTDRRAINETFPLKLHSVLMQIERDGLDSIFGWLPHGRSFKIHKEKEFKDIILPMYFRAKKSSFNRQLSLYDFKRLFRAGPDKGSYYHEKFLRGTFAIYHLLSFTCKVIVNTIRPALHGDGVVTLEWLQHLTYFSCSFTGMEFLSTEIERNAIKGNGIRAAGNPEEEPVLYTFPICPPQRNF